MSRAAYLVLALIACREPTPRQPLYPAGGDRDDGHGQLANASASLLTEAPKPARPNRPTDMPRRYREEDDEPGGDVDGSMYAGPGYGGASYASYRPPPWTYPSAPRALGFTPRAGLAGAIEGTVTWRGATPTLTTACGAVQPVRANANGALPDTVIYIQRVAVGRPVVHGNGEQRPYAVGGTVQKRGCDLLPRLQVVAPVPAAIAIHGDAKPAQITVTLPDTATKTQELQEGGRIVVPAKAGVTRVEATDGSLGAAWVVGIDAAYYALSDDRGRYRIEELAPGTYTLTIWHPPVATLKHGKLVYAGQRTIERTVRVEGNGTTRLDIALGK